MAGLKLSSVFQVGSRSVEDVMGGEALGFYIPSYQRPYAWKDVAVGALITSIVEGLHTMESMDDAMTFIGTFIFIHDQKYTTVEPKVKDDLPGKVHLVIDGQQRLTTISLIAAALHNLIGEVTAGLLKRRVDSNALEWVEKTSGELSQRLFRVLANRQSYGRPPYNHYPRIIRAYQDSWSQNPEKVQYESPVAKVLFQYITHALSDDAQSRFSCSSGEGDDKAAALVGKNYNLVRSQIMLLSELKTRKKELDEHLPDLSWLASHRHASVICDRFFRFEVPQSVMSSWAASDPGIVDRRLMSFARLSMIARYLLTRVAVTEVLVAKEDYAFDMFEALNTTGEPLTAIETFRPSVIREEELERYKDSPSREYMSQVASYVDSEKDRQKASNRLLIPFALFETGEKLGKQLRVQRNWLRQNYEKAKGLEAKRSFLRSMALMAEFFTSCWSDAPFQFGTKFDGQPLVFENTVLETRVRLCLEVLRSANHEVTIGLLARFYAEISWAPTDQKKIRALSEFGGAVLATTAFFALWRGSRVGTDSIDSAYRSVMEYAVGLGRQRKPEEGLEVKEPTVGPFKHIGGVAALTANDLRKHYRAELHRKNALNEPEWVAKAKGLAVYKQSKPLSKLLLLAAGHDSVPDPAHPGQLMNGRPDVSPMLTVDCWKSFSTIEHVAPRTPRKGEDWPKDFYIDDFMDHLGNLTLLPPAENASVGNRPWVEKSYYYKMLSSETPEVAETWIKTASKHGIELSQPTKELLERAKYAPQLQSLAALNAVPGTWSIEFVEKRSEMLALRAWKVLSPWLEVE